MKKKVFKVLRLIPFILAIAFLIAFAQYGGFKKVKISEKEVGPYTIVYQTHVGEYRHVGPIMDDIYNSLKNDYGIDSTKGFGLYYDDPQTVDKKELRSIIGCIVEGKFIDDLKEVGKKHTVRVYPASKSVVTDFPYKDRISILVAVYKVYSKLPKFIEEKQYPETPIMEIYDRPNNKIEYIASVNLSEETFKGFLN